MAKKKSKPYNETVNRQIPKGHLCRQASINMFYFLSKFLPLFVYPLGLACLLLMVALRLRRSPTWQNLILVVTFLILWLGGNRLVAMSLVRTLESQYTPLIVTEANLPQAEVIVVLGGGTRPHDFPRPITELNEAGDRLLYAAWLYQQGVAPRILLSGRGSPLVEDARPTEAEMMTDVLAVMGVPREALLLEANSFNTYENARESIKILEQEGVTNIILVTSAFHMPRAMRIFKKFEIIVTPAPTDFRLTQADWNYYTSADLETQVFNLLPTANNLSITSLVIKEYIGIVIYWWRGWL